MRRDSSPGSSEPGAFTSAPWFWVSVEARRDGGARGWSREAGLSPTGRRTIQQRPVPQALPAGAEGRPLRRAGPSSRGPGASTRGPGPEAEGSREPPQATAAGDALSALTCHGPLAHAGILNVRGRSRRPDYCPQPREYSGDQSGRSFLLLDKKTIIPK